MVSEQRPADILAGTSGYSHKAWRGTFYPPELHQDEWLGYYASRLPVVEISNTFYRMPRPQVVETWRDSVPAGFRFVIRASRRITHQKRLQDAEEAMTFLLRRVEILGPKLGALLFQLPPDMTVDVDRLRAFQDLIPEALPVAFEFHHPSWGDASVREALVDRGHTRVVTHDEPDDGKVPAEELPPVPMAYLRLQASRYSRADLEAWRQWLLASAAERALVFFRYEGSGAGPAMAETFMSLGANSRPRRGPWKTASGKQTGKRGTGNS